MYKLLLFLKKTDNKEINNLFIDHTLKYLSELKGEEVKAADIESSLLLETKYTKLCEVSVSSKEEWDKKMNTAQGKEFNKHLMDIHQFIDVIFVNYPDTQ
jgi:hypothetical protein